MKYSLGNIKPYPGARYWYFSYLIYIKVADVKGNPKKDFFPNHPLPFTTLVPVFHQMSLLYCYCRNYSQYWFAVAT